MRSLNPRSLLILTRVRQGVEVAKARLAAKPIVAKPNVDCILIVDKSLDSVMGLSSLVKIVLAYQKSAPNLNVG